jgi:hypothetical protein
MAKAKKKLLPKNFEELLEVGDSNAIKAVFETCDVDARGGSSKQAALAFDKLSDDLVRWLVEQGADISATDKYGETPLHARAGHWHARIGILLELGAEMNAGEGTVGTALHRAADRGHEGNVRLLLRHGANPNALDDDGLTPLGHALQQCGNTGITGMVAVAEILLDAGASNTPRMREFVTRIGRNFEFYRASYNRESVDAVSAALERLYALFDVPPVPRRAMHDGKAPIVAKSATWQKRHQELWELLVPSSGAAVTVQGEVIRISGRIANELDGNGGVNWDSDYKQMADALLVHLGSGEPLPDPELKEAATIVSEIKRKHGDTRRLSALAVEWVALNQKPILLPAPTYRR